jgi:hypothetical protein
MFDSLGVRAGARADDCDVKHRYSFPDVCVLTRTTGMVVRDRACAEGETFMRSRPLITRPKPGHGWPNGTLSGRFVP